MNERSDRGAILTSNPGAFAAFEFAASTRVIQVSPPPELLPASQLKRRRVFRFALEKARSGSRFGAWLERRVKWLAGRVRHRRWLEARRRPHQEIDGLSIRSSAMYAKLQEEHSSCPIDQLIVFDVYDLPLALAFAEDHHIELLVR